jgi:phage terminase Nu1 subunit (DNA packaging protein)
MDSEISAMALQRLLGINKSVLSELAEKGIAVRGVKRGTYRIETVTRYCNHLRQMASPRGREDAAAARGRLGQAQADLAEARAERSRGEVLPVAEVQALWTRKLRAFRNRILTIGDRMRSMPQRDHVKLVGELRDALTELADG